MSGALFQLLAPPRCVACGRGGREPFCAECAAELSPAAPLWLRVDPLGVLLRVHAAHAYEGPVVGALARLKVGRRPAVARALGALLAASLPPEFAALDRVIPVPAARSRLRARGFSPPRELCRGWRRPVDTRALVRVIDGPPQVGAPRAVRLTRVRGAFAVAPGARLEGQSVLLVDDVVTTGATLSDCARALWAAGAARVEAAVLARADHAPEPGPDEPPEGLAP